MKSHLFTALAVSALLCGCAQQPDSIVGTWQAKNPGAPGNSITYVFQSNGDYSYIQHAAFESIQSHQTAEGTYQISGGKLTLEAEKETMGIDADIMAEIDAREAKLNPHIHVPQDKGDVPVKIEQPTTIYNYTLDGDRLTLQDSSNFSDHGVLYVREREDESQ